MPENQPGATPEEPTPTAAESSYDRYKHLPLCNRTFKLRMQFLDEKLRKEQEKEKKEKATNAKKGEDASTNRLKRILDVKGRAQKAMCSTSPSWTRIYKR
ncbi:unnamed protein product [Wuchereria bancrofti]|uniref:Uncharacterized protein n=1 Tax=Wuchereria bancrofti TaxID=6293 RepID=A0A3P7DZS4_WUCBA|nr:unnamed protein product [Wuchereria bancrofti]